MKSFALGAALLGVVFVFAAPADAASNQCRRGSCKMGDVCRDLVAPKNFKGAERKAEMKKCMADPQNYK